MNQTELNWAEDEDVRRASDSAELRRDQGSGPTDGGDGPLKRLIDDNFLQYASYVIRDRAIPDIEDGLKPVQRRILHALNEQDDGKFTKVANIVGHTMQYHPHGDASIADALVTLTNKRYLIEGQGNFGNVLTGDPAAASRYIECRLTDLARNELFNDALTRYVPSYDGRRKEPVHLPTKLPLLLMLGAEGIAVGLATRILPHNFCELLQAQVAILQKKPFKVLPDFQQGGLMDASEYGKGSGRIRLRAVVDAPDEQTLVIREIPFGTTTDSVMASIEDAARKKKLAIQSIDDFTSAQVEIHVRLAPEQNIQRTIDKLHAFTQCEVAVSSRITAIRENRPVQMDVEEVLRYNTRGLLKTIKRELEYEQRALLEELHRKTLVQLFVEHRIYKDIEDRKSYEAVQEAVVKGVNRFRKQLRRDVTRNDVEMLLGIPIKRTSRFDIEKSRRDIDGILADLEKTERNLADVRAYAIRYLRGLLKKYGEAHPRRTRVTAFEEVAVRDLTARELAVAYDRERGYLGHSVKGDTLVECSSHDRVVLVWADGRYKVVSPPEKLFVDDDLLYCAVAKRNRAMTMVYREEGVTYMKRFTFGGAILNKEYRCAGEDSEVLLFADDKPEAIYVKYKKEKRQRIHQQVFQTSKLPVKGVKARGMQMTVKSIRWIGTQKPRGWSKSAGPSGALIDLA